MDDCIRTAGWIALRRLRLVWVFEHDSQGKSCSFASGDVFEEAVAHIRASCRVHVQGAGGFQVWFRGRFSGFDPGGEHHDFEISAPAERGISKDDMVLLITPRR